MFYKGEGLDLRIPPGGPLTDRQSEPATGMGAAGSGWLARALDDAGAGQIIWVDDLVMQCVNQAYDLALAHRAAEIGLEHLIHAMTLIEATAGILHRYNIHVSALRRESASIIAADAPLGRVAAGITPRPSEELEELLQLAAERARSQRVPVTTEAILDTLLDMKRDISSRNLLSRHRQEWDLRGASEPRERVRVSAGSHHMGASVRVEATPTTTDTVQNTRIDALERAVRELSDDLSVNRKTFVSLIEELRESRTVGGQGAGLYVTNGVARTVQDPNVESLDLDHDHIIDRLYLLERNVEAKFGELARTWHLLGERLEAMEGVLAELPAESASAAVPDEVIQKLVVLSDLSSLPERLSAMERRLLASATTPVSVTVPPELTGKMDKIDQAFAALINRLDELEERFDQPVAANWDIAPLSAGLKEIEARAGDTQLMIDTVDDRVKKVEDLLDAHRSQVAQMSSTLGTELKALASSVSAQGVGGERISVLVEDGMRGVAQTFERQNGEIAAAVTREIADRVGHLTATLQGRQNEQHQILSAISTRLAELQNLGGGGVTDDRLLVMAENYERDSVVLHEALRAINANQQTLASSMDAWRSEAKTDIAHLSNRLVHIETLREPAPALGSSAEFDELRRRIDEIGVALRQRPARPEVPEDGWSRFRKWLYGTDDWFGASWGEPAQGRKAEKPHWSERRTNEG
jgi:hypothetical protein